MDRITVSLCMIVKNEEKYLEACLESVQGHVDEVIIVDTGSTDRTVEIAERFGAKLLHFEWINDFAAARNHSIEQAKSDYILMMDADERLDEESDLQADLASGQDLYRVTIKNYVEMNGISTVKHINHRLFKNHIGFRYHGALHEQLECVGPSAPQTLTEGVAKQSYLHHMGYLSKLTVDKDKRKRNLDIILKEIEEKPTGFNYYNLGMEYRATQQWEKAFHAFATAFAKCNELGTGVFDAILYELAQTVIQLKWYEAGIDILRAALPVFPHFTDLFFQLSLICKAHGFNKDAELLLHKCLELGDANENMATNALEGYGTYFSELRLAEQYEEEGRLVDALERAVRSLQGKKSLATLACYVRIAMRANMPANDLHENIKKIYPLNQGKHIKEVAQVLFFYRHPLLESFFLDHNFNLDVAAWAIALQSVKKYEEARAVWNDIDQINAEQVGEDVILLAILLQDSELLERFKHAYNFSNREWKVFKKMLKREPQTKEELTANVEEALLKMARYVLVWGEDEGFELITQWLMGGSLDGQLKLAKLLDSYQLSNLAFEYAMSLFEAHPNNPDLLQLLGDILYRHNQLHDALSLFTKLVQLKPEFNNYARLYDLYQKGGNPQMAKETVKEMHKRFPLSIWAEELAR